MYRVAMSRDAVNRDVVNRDVVSRDRPLWCRAEPVARY